jgi:hypothetical protein
MEDPAFKKFIERISSEIPNFGTESRALPKNLNPEFWMEDPEIFARAKKIAAKSPKMRQILSNANNPDFLDDFISLLNKGVETDPSKIIAFPEVQEINPITGKPEVKFSPLSLEKAIKLSPENLGKTEIPDELRFLTEKDRLRTAKAYTESPELSQRIGKRISKLASSRGASPVVSGNLDVRPTGGLPTPGSIADPAQALRGEQGPEIAARMDDRSKVRQVMKVPSRAADDILGEGASSAKQQPPPKSPPPDYEMPKGSYSYAEELKSAPPEKAAEMVREGIASKDPSKLKAIRDFLGKVETGAGKVLSHPAVKLAGRLAGGYGAYQEGKDALENLKKGDLIDALASGTLAGSAAAGMFANPATWPLLAGGLGIKAGLKINEMLDDKGEEEAPKAYAPSSLTSKLDKELEEEMGQEDAAPSPSPTPTPEPSATPSPTPTPSPSATPSPSPEVSSNFGSKMMDILGMPSAAAAEMSQRSPASVEEKKVKVASPNLIRKYIYSMSKEKGVPPALMLALGERESSFNLSNPKVLLNEDLSDSGVPANARGLFQITPDTFNSMQKRIKDPYLKGVSHEALSDPKNFKQQIMAGIDVVLMKAKELGLDVNDPKNWNKISRLFYGFGNPNKPESLQRSVDYGNEAESRAAKYQEVIDKKEQEAKESQQSSIPSFKRDMDKTDRQLALRMGLNFNEPDFLTPFDDDDVPFFGPAMFRTPEGFSPEKLPLANVEEDMESDFLGSDESDDKRGLNAILEAFSRPQKDRSESDLMMLKSLLQGESLANIGKALSLMASGIVGAGPNKPFVTVPKLEGMETWTSLGKEGEKMLVADEQMQKLATRSPASDESRAVQEYTIDLLKNLRGENTFDESKVRNMSADQLEKLLKYEVLAGKLGVQKGKKGDDFITSAAGKIIPIANAYDPLFSAGMIARRPTGKNPAEDITVLYGYIKALDPNSAVKGGEVDLALKIGSLQQKAEVLKNQAAAGGDVVAREAVKKIKKETLELEKIARQKYELRVSPWRKQAVSRGLGDRVDEFDPYREQIRNLNMLDFANEHFGGDIEKAKQHFEKHGY